jgi:hypothetical protein
MLGCPSGLRAGRIVGFKGLVIAIGPVLTPKLVPFDGLALVRVMEFT